MAKKKLKPLSDKERGELFTKVDCEGFGYYILHYGPDLNAIERLGFDRTEVKRAIELLRKIESEILKGETYAEEDDDDEWR